jgi:hypothetical protein
MCLRFRSLSYLGVVFVLLMVSLNIWGFNTMRSGKKKVLGNGKHYPQNQSPREMGIGLPLLYCGWSSMVMLKLCQLSSLVRLRKRSV